VGCDKGPCEAPQSAAQQAYKVLYFKHGGMEYWAVSDLNSADLKAFVLRFSGSRRVPGLSGPTSSWGMASTEICLGFGEHEPAMMRTHGTQ
jgi:hypothetical protein